MSLSYKNRNLFITLFPLFIMIKEARHPVAKFKWSVGQRAADGLTKFAGSWTFILLFFLFIAAWMAVNIYFLTKYFSTDAFDPYPFILLNLILSCLAAIQAPIILMSQNRSAQKDRLRAEYDYKVNKKSEKGIRDLKLKLGEIKKFLKRK